MPSGPAQARRPGLYRWRLGDAAQHAGRRAEAGSLLDVSSGAALRSGGSLAGGRGGNVALVADYAIPGQRRHRHGLAWRHHPRLRGARRRQADRRGRAGDRARRQAAGQGGRTGRRGASGRLVADAAFTVRAGEILPADYHYTRTVAPAGERVAGVPAFSSEAPVVLGADWTLPPAQHVAYTLMVDSVPIEVTPFTPAHAARGPTHHRHRQSGRVPARLRRAGRCLRRRHPDPAGSGGAARRRHCGGGHLRCRHAHPRRYEPRPPVKVRPLQHLDAGLTGLGFSSYVIDGHQGLAVADGARIAATVPVLRHGANAPELATGADAAMAPRYGHRRFIARIRSRAG